MDCKCDGWQKSMGQIVGAQQILALHGGTYTGDQFKFCPWCGIELKDAELVTPEEYRQFMEHAADHKEEYL